MSPFFNGFQLNVVHWTDDAEFTLRTPSMIPPPCHHVRFESMIKVGLSPKYYILSTMYSSMYPIHFAYLLAGKYLRWGTMRIRLGTIA